MIGLHSMKMGVSVQEILAVAIGDGIKMEIVNRIASVKLHTAIFKRSGVAMGN